MLLVFAPSCSSDHPRGDGGGGGGGAVVGEDTCSGLLSSSSACGNRQEDSCACVPASFFKSLTTVSRVCPKPSGHRLQGGRRGTWCQCSQMGNINIHFLWLTRHFIFKKNPPPAAPLNARPSHPGNICVLQELRGCLVFLCCGRYQGGDNELSSTDDYKWGKTPVAIFYPHF